MVSKAREDLPEPERPVITVRELRGISTLMFLRLCWRAPRTTSFVRPMIPKRSLHRSLPAVCRRRRTVGTLRPGITFHDSRGMLAGQSWRKHQADWAYSEHCRRFWVRVKFGRGDNFLRG